MSQPAGGEAWSTGDAHDEGASYATTLMRVCSSAPLPVGMAKPAIWKSSATDRGAVLGSQVEVQSIIREVAICLVDLSGEGRQRQDLVSDVAVHRLRERVIEEPCEDVLGTCARKRYWRAHELAMMSPALARAGC